jgi:hypothetical protein
MNHATVRVSNRTLPLAKGELEGVPHDRCQSGREPPSIPPPRGRKHEFLERLTLELRTRPIHTSTTRQRVNPPNQPPTSPAIHQGASSRPLRSWTSRT